MGTGIVERAKSDKAESGVLLCQMDSGVMVCRQMGADSLVDGPPDINIDPQAYDYVRLSPAFLEAQDGDHRPVPAWRMHKLNIATWSSLEAYKSQ